MEFQVFKSTIQDIYDKVYRLDESISSEDRKILIMGFENGMNEGLGSFIGKTIAKTKNLFTGAKDKAVDGWDSFKQKSSDVLDKVKSKGSDMWNKGKELAKNAWESIGNFFKDIKNKVSQGLSAAGKALSNGYDAFKTKVSEVYDNAKITIFNAIEASKEKIAEFKTACQKLFTDITSKIESFFISTREKITQMKGWVSKSYESIKKSIIDAKKSGVKWFSEFAEKVSRLMESSGGKAKKISAVALFICTWPFIKMINGFKKMPEIYRNAVDSVKAFFNKEIQDFWKGYNEEMDKFNIERATKRKGRTLSPSFESKTYGRIHSFDSFGKKI
jgi:phage-related protein